MNRSRLAALLSVFLLVVAGCAAPTANPNAPTDAEDDWSWPEDPPTDRLGWENGYWYNESIEVNQSDGLNASERAAFVNRTMARVEVIRELEFEEPVPVEVISRAEYRNETPFGGEPENGSEALHADWNDQVWESILLVGEDRTINEVFDGIYGGAVLGYYSPSEDRIVLISDDDDPVVDRQTLAHELVHALQDQQFGLGDSPPTQDEQLAQNGLVEGDARYVDRRYEERCADDWECVARPSGSGSSSGSFDYPVFLTIYTPYSEGPTFVTALRERGGWDAVDDAYSSPPASTEQIIHPETYPDEEPFEVTIEDRSSDEWVRYDHDPVGDTVGEASIFTMFWKHRAIDQSDLNRNTGRYSAYNYSAGPSKGWAGDLVVPYRPASDEDATANPNQRAYVWRIAWDTEADAADFETTYVKTMLQLRLGAKRVAPNTYVIEDGPFADAFRVTRRGETVTIVNAPTVDALDEVHPD